MEVKQEKSEIVDTHHLRVYGPEPTIYWYNKQYIKQYTSLQILNET